MIDIETITPQQLLLMPSMSIFVPWQQECA
jgi:hypothetical protein